MWRKMGASRLMQTTSWVFRWRDSARVHHDLVILTGGTPWNVVGREVTCAGPWRIDPSSNKAENPNKAGRGSRSAATASGVRGLAVELPVMSKRKRMGPVAL